MKKKLKGKRCTCQTKDKLWPGQMIISPETWKYANRLQEQLISLQERAERHRQLIIQMNRTLGEAKEMLGVFEDNGGHDNLAGRGYAATLDHIDNDRAIAKEALSQEGEK